MPTFLARRALIPLIAAVLLAVGFGVYHYYTASGQPAYALKVNNQTFSPGDMATRVALAQGLAAATKRYSPNAAIPDTSQATIAQIMVTQTLELQEAQRRGIACTQVEADAQDATVIAEGASHGQTNDILATAAGLGLVPLNYLDRPVAARTPDANSVIAAYLSDPRITAASLRNCTIGKLFAQVRQQAGGRQKGEQAITDLQTRLRAAATIDGPALTPQAAATATP